MSEIASRLAEIRAALPSGVTLVAVSKTRPAELIREAYEAGQRDFGENYVQELLEKQPLLPPDIRWHFIGHLQSNKVKYIAGFVHCIHGVSGEKALKEIERQAARHHRQVSCLIQVRIAREDTKSGMSPSEVREWMSRFRPEEFPHAPVHGLMGMASFTDDMTQVRQEFASLKNLYRELREGPLSRLPGFNTLSMGMSGDWQVAVEEGSTLVRIGSALFGAR